MTWWATYDDGAVWPVELLGPGVFPGTVVVRPLVPAPDAGSTRVEPVGRVYDNKLCHPGGQR